MYSWILGQLGAAQWSTLWLALPYAVLSTTVLLACGRALDVLSVGDDEASTLGLRPRRIRFVVLLAASLGTAAAVAVSGLIGFVGLVVPHVVRRLAGGSYRTVLPVSLLGGAAFLVLADLVSRTVLAPAELPIGVVTAFVGAPFFAALLRTGGGRGADDGRRAGPALRRPPRREQAAIRVRSIAVTLRRVAVLDGVHLAVEPRSWTAVVGPNGAGKSTLLRAVAGLVRHAGEVLHRRPGQPHPAAEAAGRAARLRTAEPDSAGRPDRARVRDCSAGRPTTRCWPAPRRSDQAIADEALASGSTSSGCPPGCCGTCPAASGSVPCWPGRWPSSPRCCCSTSRPPALDLGHAQQVLELVDRLRREEGLTVLSTLHDLVLAGQYADQLVLLDRGRVVAARQPGPGAQHRAAGPPLRRPRRGQRRAGRRPGAPGSARIPRRRRHRDVRVVRGGRVPAAGRGRPPQPVRDAGGPAGLAAGGRERRGADRRSRPAR